MKKFFVISLFILTLGACAANQSTLPEQPVSDVKNSDIPVKAPVTSSETKPGQPLVISMETGNMFIKPATINAKVNQKITINFTNNGFHTFNLDAFDIALDLRNKSTGTVTFTATKIGSFEYYCDVPGHKAAGMKGTLIVTE